MLYYMLRSAVGFISKRKFKKKKEHCAVYFEFLQIDAVMSEIKDDPREVLVLLNSLGFVGITAAQLKAFMKGKWLSLLMLIYFLSACLYS